MKRTATASLVGLGLLSLTATTPSLAEPPPQGSDHVAFGVAVMCDTKEQVQDIFHNGQSAFAKYATTPDTNGEPTCALAPANALHVYENVELGLFSLTADKQVPAWALHMGNDKADGWILYIEPDGAKAWEATQVKCGIGCA